ncbi:MAG TPA: tetratricopeptide repeat protein [Acidobacteriota bacterium]|nr:tetratricopeptide repeat protein [Acidobacteriota bacterium]
MIIANCLLWQGETETLSGLVLVNDHRPGDLAPLIEIELTFLDRQEQNFKTTVSSDGEYRFGALRPGSFEITARAPGYKTVKLRVDLVRGSRTRGTTRLVLLPEIPPPASGRMKQGGVVSRNELHAPKEARKEVERAEKDLEAGHLEAASSCLAEALRIYPEYARAHFLRGRLFEKQSKLTLAVQSYEMAIREDADYFPAYAELSEIFRTASDYGELRSIADRWKEVQPLDCTPYYYSALAYFEAGEFRSALRDANMAKHFPHPNLPHVNLLLANCHLKLHDPRAAAQELQEFLMLRPDDPLAHQARETLATIKRLLAP